MNQCLYIFMLKTSALCLLKRLLRGLNLELVNKGILVYNTVEPRFNEVAGDRLSVFVKWRVRYIENLDITNLSGNDQKVRYIEVIVND